jgi:SAM-dependent methyltransferase
MFAGACAFGDNLVMRSPIERFTGRVESYVRYRPSYPSQVEELLKERCGLSSASRVADLGAGTGILTAMLLQTGAEVWGVEPNASMRAAAERLLGSQPRFHSIAGSAEDTMLATASVDLITAGQSFHWFDVAHTRVELARILVRDGWVALIWNDRPRSATPFLAGYDELLRRHAPEYAPVSQLRARAERPESIRALFGGAYERANFPNRQSLDFEGLVGRTLSSSTTPEPGDPGHEPMLAALRELFAQHQQHGEILFTYETRVYFGQLRRADIN